MWHRHSILLIHGRTFQKRVKNSCKVNIGGKGGRHSRYFLICVFFLPWRWLPNRLRKWVKFNVSGLSLIMAFITLGSPSRPSSVVYHMVNCNLCMLINIYHIHLNFFHTLNIFLKKTTISIYWHKLFLVLLLSLVKSILFNVVNNINF